MLMIEETSQPIAYPRVILITGNMAAGKSSVAQALAEQLPQSVHLRGDMFRRFIVNGQAEMTADLSTTAVSQLQLRYQIATASAILYWQAGFTVVYQDIIIGPALNTVVAMLAEVPLSVVVRCPQTAVIAHREAQRNKTGYGHEADIATFDHVLHTETPRLGYWLDSSNLTIAETVSQIQQHLPQASLNL
jgi:predicted kinase